MKHFNEAGPASRTSRSALILVQWRALIYLVLLLLSLALIHAAAAA